jgi:hypothetical protein
MVGRHCLWADFMIFSVRGAGQPLSQRLQLIWLSWHQAYGQDVHPQV